MDWNSMLSAALGAAATMAAVAAAHVLDRRRSREAAAAANCIAESAWIRDQRTSLNVEIMDWIQQLREWCPTTWTRAGHYDSPPEPRLMAARVRLFGTRRTAVTVHQLRITLGPFVDDLGMSIEQILNSLESSLREDLGLDEVSTDVKGLAMPPKIAQ
jgi:hypothetical protein